MGKEVKGSSVASNEAYVRTLVRQAETLWRFDNIWQEYFDGDYHLVSVRVIFPGLVGGEFKAVLKVEYQGQKLVAFHNAETLVETLVGLLNRLENRTLKFKEDQYA